jgi:hypothetical protein
LAYAFPTLLVCVAVHLAFWPAQMSPDSISQWQQVVHGGGGDDWHPALTFVMWWLSCLLVPHPAFALAMQYSVFALCAGILLREVQETGLSAGATQIVAVIFALFPPTFLIATSLWKDVPYTSGMMLLTTGMWRLVRTEYRLTMPVAVLLSVGGLLMLGTRHNGVLVVIPTLLVLAMLAPWGRKRAYLGLAALQVGFWVVTRTVLLWLFAVAPIPGEYRALVAFPIIGAMVAESETWPLSEDDRKLVEAVLPLEQWREGYRCDTVVPLFWNEPIDRQVVAENSMRLTLIAARWALTHPAAFAKHQLCMTRILWDPTAEGGEEVYLSPLAITPLPEQDAMGLTMEPALPDLRVALLVADSFWGPSATYNRPATYVYLGLAAAILLSRLLRANMVLVFLPAALNVIGLLPVIGSQDYRYVWPSQVISLVMILMLVLLAVQRVRERRAGPIPAGSAG